MLHACIGMPTFSCLPACTAACTSPNSCPGLGKIPCVTPALYDSPQAFPYPATETARGARPCATKANTHQRASYPCRGKSATEAHGQMVRMPSSSCSCMRPESSTYISVAAAFFAVTDGARRGMSRALRLLDACRHQRARQ